jgi:hypothetical protein
MLSNILPWEILRQFFHIYSCRSALNPLPFHFPRSIHCSRPSVLEPHSATSSKFRRLNGIAAAVVNTYVSISSPSSHFSFAFQALPICRTDKFLITILLLRRSVSSEYTAQSQRASSILSVNVSDLEFITQYLPCHNFIRIAYNARRKKSVASSSI